MLGIFDALQSSSSALSVFSQALDVASNDVSNSSTPGYAAQTQEIEPLAFQPDAGIPGGVSAGEVISSRDQYAEQGVRQQTTLLGAANQNVSTLTSLQSIFTIAQGAGLPNALSNLYSAFSAWGQSPADGNAQQTVIDDATNVANQFQETASQVATAAQDVETQSSNTVDEINSLTQQLASYNAQAADGRQDDAGLDAQINSTLEQLSQYVDVSTVKQDDGTMAVLINGQTPLVIGSQQYQLSYELQNPSQPPPTNPGAPPEVRILSNGSDVTSQISGGQLGALLDLHNNVLASIRGDAYQTGSLNTLAQQFADNVNQTLTSGDISSGPPPVAGVPLFTYDGSDATATAGTLAVNPNVSAGQLAAIDPGPPTVSNGIPLQLAALADPQSAADEINGASYVEYYGQIAAGIGTGLSNATDQQQVQQSAVAQAQNIRQQISGVSLDKEAVIVTNFQRAYEATARMINQLDQITLDTINMLPSS